MDAAWLTQPRGDEDGYAIVMPAGPVHTTYTWDAAPPLAERRAPSRVAQALPQVVIALLLIAAVGLYWRWQHTASPAGVVDRCGSALKQKDWHTVYSLIAWPRYRAHMDEQAFTTFASLYGQLYSLDDYQIGSPQIDGDVAIVPVTVTARFNSLVASSTRTDRAEVRCRLVDGEWRIAPDLRNGFLGVTIAGRGGLR